MFFDRSMYNQVYALTQLHVHNVCYIAAKYHGNMRLYQTEQIPYFMHNRFYCNTVPLIPYNETFEMLIRGQQ